MLPEGYTMVYDCETGEGYVWSSKSNMAMKKLKPGGNRKYFWVSLKENKKRKNFDLHRLIAHYWIPNPNNLKMVDHIDGNKLNNRISNLRWVTNSENTHNQQKFKGYSKKGNRYIARIRVNKKEIYLGCFDTEEQARSAYLEASAKYFPNIKYNGN